MHNVLNVSENLQDERSCICLLNVGSEILDARARAVHIHKWKGTIQIEAFDASTIQIKAILMREMPRILMRHSHRDALHTPNYHPWLGSAKSGWIV
jgi:hypothetical protein